jgi:hypothetical protein
MTDDTLLPFDLPAVRRKKLTVDFEGGNQSSDRYLDYIEHAMFEMMMSARRRLRQRARTLFQALASRSFYRVITTPKHWSYHTSALIVRDGTTMELEARIASAFAADVKSDDV